MVRNACLCPSFCIGIAGPWICVLGAVLTDNVIVQPLTDYIWLDYDFTKLYSIAQLFCSLASGLKDLDKYYRSLSRADAPLPERMFPYIRSFLFKGQEVAFSYIKPLSGRKPIFLAQLDDKTKVVVKFVHSYSSVAHRLVANAGLAPCLLYCGMDDASAPFFGRLKMVVMDYIEGVSAHYIMQKMRLNPQVYESVRRALDILHNSNFVFGDLRPANIMIDAKGTAWLVDFDWCSIEGQG
ncbi:hypothetical protein K439DRAFT_776432 [Ramaria rubella]|nr:hypothetical protein K439DRAFT_776432 [Ramaria rubella]